MDIYGYFLSAFSCLCFLPTGCKAECSPAVLARRHTFYVPAGGSLLLSCDVRHCREAWTGHWEWKNSSGDMFKTVTPTRRHHLSNITLSANQTRLVLKILSVNQSDDGLYKCSITWGQGTNDEGHISYVNITSVPSGRNVLNRILVCAGASLCFPIILGLTRCLSSEVKPQPLPSTLPSETHQTPQPPPRCPLPQKHNAYTHKATPKSQQKTEPVYAALSQNALEQPRAAREPEQATVYSSLKFA
ncbi:hypothetical protein LDENG_00114820 [Lucifuga dentata]|nr:hypothetical protein LDENG_00114820 [Lucifuga dentata]